MKPLIVIYINIGNIPPNEVDEVVQKTMEKCKLDNNEFESFWIPVRTGETRVECVNPVVTAKDDYEKIKIQLELLSEKLKQTDEKI